jgi:Lrp/AsnC family leucine-responsive transcriptional regulator
MPDITEPKLDRIDLRLLAALQCNARATTTGLAQVVHLSPTAVARRQRTLEDDGVIVGYRTELDFAKFGLRTTVIVHITLQSQGGVQLREFEEAVQCCASVTACFLMSGADDYLLVLRVRDLADFEHVHKSQLSRLPHVARIQSSFGLREIVRRYVPQDLFDRS